MAFIGNGAQLTDLDAGDIASGTVAPARLGSGTPSSSNFLRGDGSWQTPAGAPNPLHSKQIFTSSGTFTAPTGVTAILVSVIGAGGNGGNGTESYYNGGGGGAGGYIVDYLTITPGGTASVTIGTSGGSRTSSFAVSGGSTLTAAGGGNGSNAGYNSPSNSGASGASTIFGLTNYLPGGTRQPSYFSGNSNISTSASNQIGSGQVWGHGFGAGGRENYSAASGSQNAIGYGGGGGGGGTDTFTSGGSGGNGLVIVEW